MLHLSMGKEEPCLPLLWPLVTVAPGQRSISDCFIHSWLFNQAQQHWIKQTSLECAHWMNSNDHNTSCLYCVFHPMSWQHFKRQGGDLFLFIFMNTSVEKMSYSKMKHFCRRHWWRKQSRNPTGMLPVSSSSQYTLFPKLIKKWILPNLSSKHAALILSWFSTLPLVSITEIVYSIEYCLQKENIPLDQAAKGPIQLGLELFQGRGIPVKNQKRLIRYMQSRGQQWNKEGIVNRGKVKLGLKGKRITKRNRIQMTTSAQHGSWAGLCQPTREEIQLNWKAEDCSLQWNSAPSLWDHSTHSWCCHWPYIVLTKSFSETPCRRMAICNKLWGAGKMMGQGNTGHHSGRAEEQPDNPKHPTSKSCAQGALGLQFLLGLQRGM